jgi:phage-related protein
MVQAPIHSKDMQKMGQNVQRKPIVWIGNARTDLCNFPAEPRKACGGELAMIQNGEMPSDWKAFESIGPGTKEIRVRDRDGIYRVMYVAKFEEAVYVLHCFQKKSQTSSQHDKNLAIARYKLMLNERIAVATSRKETK